MQATSSESARLVAEQATRPSQWTHVGATSIDYNKSFIFVLGRLDASSFIILFNHIFSTSKYPCITFPTPSLPHRALLYHHLLYHALFLINFSSLHSQSASVLSRHPISTWLVLYITLQASFHTQEIFHRSHHTRIPKAYYSVAIFRPSSFACFSPYVKSALSSPCPDVNFRFLLFFSPSPSPPFSNPFILNPDPDRNT